MKKFILIFIVFIVGCASSSAQKIQLIKYNYKTVDLTDGVSIEEAKTVAQNEALEMNLSRLYDFQDPIVDTDVSDLPNNDQYWFIYFKELSKDTSMPFIFMVVVNKKTGNIKFAEDYIKEKKWILESALLK